MNTRSIGSPPVREVVRYNVWQIGCLLIPIGRVILYVTGVAPGQLSEMVLPRPIQAVGVGMLGLTALVAIVGVLAQRPIIERTALRLLVIVAVAYTIVLLYADAKRASVYAVVYLIVAAASAWRAREITRAMRLTNRVLARRDRGRRHA